MMKISTDQTIDFLRFRFSQFDTETLLMILQNSEYNMNNAIEALIVMERSWIPSEQRKPPLESKMQYSSETNIQQHAKREG